MSRLDVVHVLNLLDRAPYEGAVFPQVRMPLGNFGFGR
jgi:hypothetical protein